MYVLRGIASIFLFYYYYLLLFFGRGGGGGGGGVGVCGGYLFIYFISKLVRSYKFM